MRPGAFLGRVEDVVTACNELQYEVPQYDSALKPELWQSYIYQGIREKFSEWAEEQTRPIRERRAPYWSMKKVQVWEPVVEEQKDGIADYYCLSSQSVEENGCDWMDDTYACAPMTATFISAQIKDLR